jgi:hypothetical protein
MEYMLLSDGSVKTFERLDTHSDVIDALHDYGGSAYYWWDETFQWSCITSDTPKISNAQVKADAVPDIIKLALMLQ